MRAVWVCISVFVCVCVCTSSMHMHVCADSNLANSTFRCSERKDFEMCAFQELFLAKTVTQTTESATKTMSIHLSYWWQVDVGKKVWIWLNVDLPWTGAGALPVHDSTSTGSRAIWPLRPGWPLAVDCLRTMLAKLDTLTLPTPLGKREDMQEEQMHRNSFISSSWVLIWATCLSFAGWINSQHHTWAVRLFSYSQKPHSYTYVHMHHTWANPNQILHSDTSPPLSHSDQISIYEVVLAICVQPGCVTMKWNDQAPAMFSDLRFSLESILTQISCLCCKGKLLPAASLLSYTYLLFFSTRCVDRNSCTSKSTQRLALLFALFGIRWKLEQCTAIILGVWWQNILDKSVIFNYEIECQNLLTLYRVYR